MQRSRFVFGVALAAGAVCLACSRGGAGQASPSPSASASSAAPGRVHAFLANEKQPMTAEIEEQLLLALSTCKVNDDGIQRSCPAYRNLQAARNHKWQVPDPLAAAAAVGARHLADASPAVRLRAAQLMGGIADKSAATRKRLVAAARKEKVPGVLVAMLSELGAFARQDPDVAPLLLQMADNPAPRVRMEAMGWMLRPGADVQGGFEKVSHRLDTDPSLRVREYLCSRLYGSENPRAIDGFKKYLTSNNTPPRLAQSCFDGLIRAWTGFPLPNKPLQQAYELTLKVLTEKPRTQQRPPFAAISSLRAARTDYKPADKAGVAWLDKVKPWYKKARLLAALESLAGDLNANWLARSSALGVMEQLGAPKAAFQHVLSRYAKATGRDVSVRQHIQAIIKGTIVPPHSDKPPSKRPPQPKL